MKRMFAALAALSLFAVAACSSDDADTAPSADGPAVDATEVEVVEEVPESEPATVDSVVAAFESLGYECGAEEGLTFCVQGSENWQVGSTDHPLNEPSFVRAMCDSDEYEVDGEVLQSTNVVVFAGNNGQDYNTMNDRLNAEGVEDLELVDNCA